MSPEALAPASEDIHPRREAHFGPTEWGLTALIAVIWGASFLFIRVGVESFGPGLVPLIRIAFGAIALVLVPASRRPVARSDWPAIALLGLIWMAIPFLLFSLAEQTVPTAVTGMINGAVPLSSAGVAAVWHRRAPSPVRALALLTGLAGVTVIAFAATGDEGADTNGFGVAMLLAAVLCYGVSANVALPLQRRYGALPVLLRVQLVALVASMPYGFLAVHSARWSWGALACMAALGALGTGLAYAASSVLVGRTDATRGTIGVFLTPIVAAILGVFVRHEELPRGALVGATLVLLGAVLTSRPEPAWRIASR